jgi:hypothetical protein
LLQQMAAIDPLASSAIVLGIAILAAAALRWLGTLLEAQDAEPAARLGVGERAFLGGGVLICLLLGTFPQVFAGIFDATRGFSNLIP